MGESNAIKHTREEVLDFLQTSETAVIATSAGETLRLRMMHLGVEDDFSIYLATMHNDPKVIQMLNHPSVSILTSSIPADITQAEEVEYVGKAVLLREPGERQKCLESTAKTSPIVQALMEQGNTGVLDCIKIVPQWVKYRKFEEIVQGVPPTVIEFPQNRNVVSDWSLLGNKFKNWWAAVRVNSLAASLVPVLLGAAVAGFHFGTVNIGMLVLTLVAALMLQAGTNVLNDYSDHYSGADRKNLEFIRPFTGGSRVIQLGLLTPLELLVGGSLLCAGALGIGLYMAFSGLPWVLPLGVIGAASGVLYNKVGWNLVRTGLGELAIGLNFGILMTLGAYYVQTGVLSWAPVLASLPISVLITAVIYINEFQDYEADQAVGKTTWIVRMGKQLAAARFWVFFAAAYALLLALVAFGEAPATTLLGLVALPLAVRAVQIAQEGYANSVDLAPANGYTALTHLVFGLLQTLGYVATALGSEGVVYTVLLGVAFIAFAWYMHIYTERLRQASISVKKAMARS